MKLHPFVHGSFLRLLVLLDAIPEAPARIATSDLAARLAERGLVVTRRTVQRDLEHLSRVLPLCCETKSRPYGWAWVQGRSVTLPQPVRRALPTAELEPTGSGGE